MTYSTNSYPPPSVYGLPSKFNDWRTGQYEAIQASLASNKRFIVHNAPTGFGKSLTVLAESLMTGSKTLILTANKPLQDQYMRDGASLGMLDIRGQSNYTCNASLPGGEHYSSNQPTLAVNEAPCHYGATCSLKTGGCVYYDKLRQLRYERLAVTNYSMLLYANRYSEGLGRFPLLILDEAHAAPEQLSNAMSVALSKWTIKNYICPLNELSSSGECTWWASWALHYRGKLQSELDLERGQPTRKHKVLVDTIRVLQQIAQIDDGWVIYHDDAGYRFAPIWVAAHSERYLFRGADKVLLVSATIRSKTLSLLGVDPDQAEFFSYPSTFSITRRPVYFMPTVRMHFGMSESDVDAWCGRVDQIIAQRLNRRGIIHTVSFARQQQLLARSRFRQYMIANRKGESTHETVERFKRASAPCILVSPSVDTGFDFPYAECSYIIIAKVPFPDASDPVYSARASDDPDYGIYLAGQSLVQMAGRGMRAEDDYCETFILDSTFGMFRGRYRDMLPEWFQDAVIKVDVIPKPGTL